MEWETIKTYFQAEGVQKLVEHQIESFEDFIRNKIPLIVSSTAPIVVWHQQDEQTKKYKYEPIPTNTSDTNSKKIHNCGISGTNDECYVLSKILLFR